MAPKMEERYEAMEQIAKAGILTGISMMPILPGLCDTDENLEATVRWTAEHGGQFVIAGGLTLVDQQRAFFFKVLRERFPDLLPLHKRRYPAGAYCEVPWGDWHDTARRVKEMCARHGIRDRMPRPVIPGDKRALLRQADRRSAGERGVRHGAARRGEATGVGVPEGGMGHRGHGAGRGADLPDDG
ncbi:MAG: hypothetical protein EHM35_21185 [Planctomycetaceae bacterium]|nr:MAG: hypothetical protein EHM35_21185 [Planctomycetaceae bacterium]